MVRKVGQSLDLVTPPEALEQFNRSNKPEHSRQPNSPKFNSSMVQEYLCEVDDASPDILFLYDTCHSANGHGSIDSTRSAIALLAACGFESIAAEVGPHSFTYALIQELSDAARQHKAISVPQLHSSLLNRLHLQRQDVLLQEKEDGKVCIRTTPDGIPLFELPVWRTPIYIQLSRNVRPRAIMLAPLPRKSTSNNDPGFISLDPQPEMLETSAQPGKGAMHVLLRVSLAEDSFNMEEFKEWICDAPEPARQIKVITTLPSCSTLVLLQMPVELWDMLPPSPAISFVGFVVVDEVSGSAEGQSRPDTTTAPSKPGITSLGHTSRDEQSIVAILDSVDSILPAVFRETRQRVSGNDTLPEAWVVTNHVIDKLEKISCLQASSFAFEHSSLHKVRFFAP